MNEAEIVNRLKKWLAKEDFDSQKLKLIISENKNEGRCVVAAEDFKENEVLLRIPMKFLINYTNALNVKDLKEFFAWYSCLKDKDGEDKLTRLDALYLYLIHAYSDADSDLSPFIASFPTQYDTPENFDPVIVSVLPTALKRIIEIRVQALKNKHECVERLLRMYSVGNAALSETMKKLIENFSLELLVWIYCCVNTRCFHLDELNYLTTQSDLDHVNKLFGALNRNIDRTQQKQESQEVDNLLCCLIPFLDYMNHSFGSSNVDCFFDKDEKCYVLQSKCEIAVNEQVYGTYGYYDNKTLLVEYGFILEDNPYDTLSFEKTDLSRLASNICNEKFESFWRVIVEHKLNADLTCNVDPGPSWSLLKAIDFLFQLNELDPEAEFCDYDFHCAPKDAAVYFRKLLDHYKAELECSIGRLSDLIVAKSYHIQLNKRFCQLQLGILNKNLEILNDDCSWSSLF